LKKKGSFSVNARDGESSMGGTRSSQWARTKGGWKSICDSVGSRLQRNRLPPRGKEEKSFAILSKPHL